MKKTFTADVRNREYYTSKKGKSKYIPERLFELVDTAAIGVVGVTKFNKVKEESTAVLNYDGILYEVEEVDGVDLLNNCDGIIEVSGGKYVAVIDRCKVNPPLIYTMICFGVIFIATLIVLLNLPGNNTKSDVPSPDNTPTVENAGNKRPIIADGEDGDDIELPTVSTTERRNKYKGFAKVYISKDSSIIPWVNDKTNVSYIGYKLYDGDKLVYKTDGYIAPGQHVDWDALELVSEPGEYVFNLVTTFYSPVYKNGEIDSFVQDGFNYSLPNFTIVVTA